ncbi:MAG: GldG family protein [Magnetococcales bacterium]|nr:GldG family protein [Magnetococcales bacterium]
MNRSTRLNLRAQNLFTGLLLAALLGIAAYATDQYPKRWDWTVGGRHSLAEQSLKAIQGFKDDLSAVVYVQEKGEQRQEAQDLLEKYRVANPILTVRFVDPDLDPAAARREEISTYGTVVLRSGAKSEKVTELTEEALTNGLIRLVKGTVKTLAFLTGHGEHPLTPGERDAYGTLAQLLKGEGYEVTELDLAGTEAVPEQTAVVVLAGPRKPLLPVEVERLERWLGAKGRLLVLRDPDSETGLEPLLQQFGIGFSRGLVVDPVSRVFGGGPTTPLISEYDATHPITRELRLAAFFAEAGEVTVAAATAAGDIRTRLVSAAPRGWLETGDLGSGQVEFDPAADTKGPIWMGVAVEKGAQRLVALGDSDFASDTYVKFSGNGDLILNTVRWLAEDEHFIAIKPKKVQDAGLTLSPGSGIVLFWGLLVLMPLILAGSGLLIWTRRKKR